MICFRLGKHFLHKYGNCWENWGSQHGKKRQDSVGPQAQFLGGERNTQGSRVCGLMSRERKWRRGSWGVRGGVLGSREAYLHAYMDACSLQLSTKEVVGLGILLTFTVRDPTWMVVVGSSRTVYYTKYLSSQVKGKLVKGKLHNLNIFESSY